MKKVISILMSILVLMTTMCICATATSSSNSTYTYETEDAVYTIEFNDNNLTVEEQKTVVSKLVDLDENVVQTYGLGCTLFGHDYKYTSASVITHKYRASDPRCKKDLYNVKYCEDCDFTEETLTSSVYIVCCD